MSDEGTATTAEEAITGCIGQTTPVNCLPTSNHPQSLNPQDKVDGNPHEDPKLGTDQNPQMDVTGPPHYTDR